MAVTLEVLVNRQVADERGTPSPDQFESLYAASFRPLVSYCRRILGGAADPEEVAQEAFVRAWRSWDSYSTDRPFWPWLVTIARRICIDQRRHSATVTTTLRRRATELSGRAGVLPEEALQAKEEQRLALSALATLKPDQRRVIGLRDLDGWSYEDIAKFEGVTVEAVRGSLRRARQRLRDAYVRLGWSAPAVLILQPLRRIRRKVELWAHRAAQYADVGGVATVRAGEAVATLVALTVVAVMPNLPHGGGSNPTTVSAAGGANGASASATGADSVAGSQATGSSGGVGGSGGAGSAGSHGGSAGGNASSAAGGTGAGQGSGSSPLAGTPGLPGRPGTGTVAAAAPDQGGKTPEQATFTDFEASPDYPKHQTVFATGTSYENCSKGDCPVIFRSDDGGSTWTKLKAFRYQGGNVMLPPAYPADRRIFVAGVNALQVSDDDGLSFRDLTPLGGEAAMSPGFSANDPRILVGAAPGWVYHDDQNGAVTPFDMAPAPSGNLSFAFSPSYQEDGKVLVGGAATGAQSPPPAVVSVCQQSGCGPQVALGDSVGVPSLLASRSFAQNGVAWAWHWGDLYRTSDGGSSFAPLKLPTSAGVQSLVEDDSGALYAALLGQTADGKVSVGGLFMSHDEGTTWTRLGGGTGLDKGADTVAVLPGGRLIAGPHTTSGGGLLCSDDAGHTWRQRCA